MIHVRILGACALVSLGAVAQAASAPGERPGARAVPPQGTVTTVIDYGDGSYRMFEAPWRPDMTVWSALDAAQSSPHPVRVEKTGSGETVFVTRIDDLRNEGMGAGKRNWQYWLNGDLGTAGAGARRLSKGDKAVWKFSLFEGEGAKRQAN